MQAVYMFLVIWSFIVGYIIEAHCYVAQHRQTYCEQRINQQLIFVSYIPSCMQLTNLCCQNVLQSTVPSFYMSLLMHQFAYFITCALIVRTLVMAKSK